MLARPRADCTAAALPDDTFMAPPPPPRAALLPRLAALGLTSEAMELCYEIVSFRPDPREQEKAMRERADPTDWTTGLEPRPKPLEKTGHVAPLGKRTLSTGNRPAHDDAVKR